MVIAIFWVRNVIEGEKEAGCLEHETGSSFVL